VATDAVTHRFFGTDSALFLGPLVPPSAHTHHAIQGCVALEGAVSVELPPGESLSAAAVLIGADVPHSVSASGLVAHFYTLPESADGIRLVRALSGHPAMQLEEEALGELRGLLLEALRDDRLFPSCLDALIQLALRGAPAAPPRDERVVTVLESLRFRSSDTPLADLAREVGLSPDRLRHLIREQVGIPLRLYRRWLRVLVAIENLRDGASVTDAACAAGFADSAHLSRTFRKSFTFPPSAFLRNSRFVQAHREGPV